MQEIDLFIIGKGAAGLTAALYGARLGLSVIVCAPEQSRQITSITMLENYPGIFPASTGQDFMEKLTEQVKSAGAVFLNQKVTALDKTGSLFKVTCERQVLFSKTLVLASGTIHKKLNVPGEEKFLGNGVSYCAVCDGPFFKEKTVVVVGGGESACAETLYLAGICKKVLLIHRKKDLKAAAAVQKKIFSAKNIQAELGFQVLEIKGDTQVESVLIKNVETGQEKLVECSGVFVFIGMNAASSLLEFIEKDSQGFIITDESMATKIPGLFCAGDVRSKKLRQLVTAVSDGAVAAYSAKEYIDEL